MIGITSARFARATRAPTGLASRLARPRREAETREDALKQVEAMTEDSYQCFAVDDDGTCIDLTGTFPGCLAGVVK